MSVNSIIGVYKLASLCDKNQGKDWYRNAYEIASSLAVFYNTNPLQIAAVIASLSPRNRWERNIQDAESLCKIYFAGGSKADLLSHKVCTFGAGKKKAVAILTGNVTDRDELLAILKGPKLCEFFNCIIGDLDDVCIDGHAYSIWLGDRISLKNVPAISNKLRQTIKADYKTAAQDLGLHPYELQAITWVAYKRIHGI